MALNEDGDRSEFEESAGGSRGGDTQRSGRKEGFVGGEVERQYNSAPAP
jgi:hypothetical protein